MGNTCPSGFERGPDLSCHAVCPGMFKYNSESPVEKCVYATNNKYSFPLRPLPFPPKGKPVPSEYASERARVDQEQAKLLEKIRSEASTEEAISTYKDEQRNTIQRHSSLQSQYASYAAAKEVGDAIDKVTKSLKPMRPPTAPAEDIHKERRAILQGSGPNFLVFQIALVILLMCLLVYVFVPPTYAHGIVVLLLSVGIAVGIFLKK